jgi:hypothetical protein
MEFRNKTIFIISHENWGKMLMSKHHYAVELAKLGNKVFFINHPDKKHELSRGQVLVQSTEYKNVSVVHHRFIHPYFLKYRFKKLYNVLTHIHIGRIIKHVRVYPDIVWSFDAGNTLPLKYFPRSILRIFMPVDGPFGHEDEIRASDKSDFIISVTPQILSTFKHLDTPKFLINHGVSDAFINNNFLQTTSKTVRVGYSGNLLRSDIDTQVFVAIIQSHPHITFEFWGEHDFSDSKIHLPQDVGEDSRSFIRTLKRLPNVILHGPVSSTDLAVGLARMDILLICYNIKNAQNSHKILEYLGTGAVVVSTYLSAYVDSYPGLIEMVKCKDNNDEFSHLFSKVLSNLAAYNSNENKILRKDFAGKYSYSKNVKRIEEFVNSL